MRETSLANAQSALLDGDQRMGKQEKSRWQGWQVRAGLVVVLTTLTACQTTAEMKQVDPTSYTKRHPIVVTTDVVSLKIQGSRAKRGLTNVQRSRLSAFLADYVDNSSGPLKINSPSSAANDVVAAGALAEVRKIIERNSIARSQIRMVNYYPRNRRASSPVILSYRRHKAVTNKCGAWPESNTITYKNQPSWSFGCATQNNLAAMVANPHDLLGPRSSTPADAQRRDNVLTKYREGAVTTAERGANESGAVSSVAQ